VDANVVSRRSRTWLYYRYVFRPRIHHAYVLRVVIVGFAACHEPMDAPLVDAPLPVCDDVQYAATFVGSEVFGPASGTPTSLAVPMTPTTGGELLVMTVTSPTGDTGWIRMVGGDAVFQVGASSLSTLIFSVGNVQPGVSSFVIEQQYKQPPPTYAVLVMRFVGLPPDIGAKLSHDYSGSGTVEACPGTVIVSAATSQGDPSLLPESPFIARKVVDGVASAYYIPSAAGVYAASWAPADDLLGAIVQFD
jgi:hypothetical protein